MIIDDLILIIFWIPVSTGMTNPGNHMGLPLRGNDRLYSNCAQDDFMKSCLLVLGIITRIPEKL
jgi:hypothetical protein